MDARTVERVEGWQDRSAPDGFAGLRDLADRSFSGAVRNGGAWLFMLNGRVVGVFDGRLDDFESGSATAYQSTDPAEALLLAMQETGGQTRGRYYTEETPLVEVDDTLSEGSFTGYVELSENVLSGDYYVVYSSGRSSSVAYVGASEKLLTDDEAYERTVDEVGIYEVVDVDLDVVEIPEPAEPADGGADAAVGAVPDAESTAQTEPERDAGEAETGADEPVPDAGPDADEDRDAEREPPIADAEPGAPDAPAGGPVAEAESAGTSGDAAPASATETATEPGAATGGEASAGAAVEQQPPESDGVEAEAGTPDAGEVETGAADATGAEATPEAETDEDVFSEEEQWRETRTIPALDPEETDPSVDADGERPPDAGAERGRQPTGERPTDPGVRELREAVKERQRQLSALRERLAEVEAEREALVAERDGLRAERDDLAEERDRLRATLEETRAELSTVREELEAARQGGGAAGAGGSGGAAGRSLSAAEALAATNLFVRYDSKGAPTLESARDADADREAVDANLRLEHHTQFEADGATVDGRPYRDFLAESLEYRFVDWLVRDLLYEIRDSGHRSGLADLFDAIPEIDRAQLDGTVTVQPEGEDAEPTERTFDVVLRDKMGRPLVVADLSTGREPVTDEMMASLIDDSTAVGEAGEHLGAAVYVTASFFRPDALEAATEATGGGFLTRDKRESYVRVARKQGYHLCLVEAREGSFHVSIPEL